MPFVQFDRNVYLRGTGVGAGDFKIRERHDLPTDVADRCVRAGDAHYVDVDGAEPAPAARAASASHPFVAAANILRQQPTAEIVEELAVLGGVSSAAPVEEAATDADTTEAAGCEDASGTGQDDPPAPPPDPEPKANTCATCNGRVFATAAALAAHTRKKH
jgi:hypothetical protein